MELKINNVTFPEAINFNFDEIKQELSNKVEHYKNLVYTDDQIKDAKKDVAELRKFIKALSDERIKVKKQCLAPYEAFEKKVKELEAVVNEPIALIDSQVKEYVEKQKQEKKESIEAYWNEILSDDKVPEGMSLQKIWNEKWLNASTSMKSVQEEINSRLEQIATDLRTLENLPEFGFEAKEVYKDTLDINKAIQEGHRLSEIQKAKEAQKAEQEAKKVEENINPPVEEEELLPFTEDDDDFIPAFDGNEAIWRNYKIELTTSQKTALEQFMTISEIKFEEI